MSRLDPKTSGGTALVLSDLVGTGDYTVGILLKPLANPSISVVFQDASGKLRVLVTKSGAQHYLTLQHDDGASKSISFPIALSTAYFAHARYNATADVLEFGYNGGFPVASLAGVGNIASLTATTHFGDFTGNTDSMFDGETVAKFTAASRMNDAELLAITQELRDVFGLALTTPESFVVPQNLVRFPDAIARPRSVLGHVVLERVQAAAPAAPTFADAYAPARLARAEKHASHDGFVARPARQDRTSPYVANDVEFPERIDGRSMPASAQQAHAMPSKPERASAFFDDEIYPSSITRPQMPASEQMAFATSSRPERTAPLASTVFADDVRGRWYSAALQLAFAEPRIERRAPLASIVFADDVRRPTFGVGLQTAFAEPRIERTSPLGPAVFADQVRRPWYAAALQLAFAEPRIDRTAPFSPAEFDDVVPRRAWFGVALQTAFAEPRIERATPLAATVFADDVRRPAFATSMQLAFVQPRIERTSPFAPSVFADDARRTWFTVSLQTAFVEPRIERTAPAADDLFPDALTRAFYRTDRQQAFAIAPQQPAAPAVVYGPFATYPDAPPSRIARQGSTAQPTISDRNVVFVDGVRPDSIARIVYDVARQRAFHEAPFQPAAAPAAPTQGYASYPSTIARAVFAPAAQRSFAFTPIDRRLAFFDALYPHAVRAAARPFAHVAWFDVNERPEAQRAYADAIYPDFTRRAAPPPTPWIAWSPTSERARPSVEAFYPAETRRAAPAFAHVDWTTRPELVDRPFPHTAIVFPDAIDRAAFSTAEQRAFGGPVALTIDLPFTVFPTATFADSVRRPSFDASEQQAFADFTYARFTLFGILPDGRLYAVRLGGTAKARDLSPVAWAELKSARAEAVLVTRGRPVREVAMTFKIKQGDLDPPLTMRLEEVDDDGVRRPIPLPGTSVRLVASRMIGGPHKIDAPATILDEANGLVQYAFAGTDTDTKGRYFAQWKITGAGGRERSVPQEGFFEIEVTDAL